jgi:hypothetical protein
MHQTRKQFHIPVGDDLTTGERFALPITAFHRGGYFTGQSGQGKSSTICRMLVDVTRRGSPAIVIDDAGETFQQLERFAAFYAAELHDAMVRADFPAYVRRRVLREKVLRRFTFGFVGHGRANAVGLDLLKRRQLPGRRESIEEVVIATLKPFEARFTDMTVRTRFVRVFRPLITALVAAERPITEAEALLVDPRYWRFLRREIERCKTLDDPASREFVEPALHRLRRILDLRLDKEGNEHEPYPQRYWDRIESTWNAIEPFSPGGVVGRFFDSDTFDPEEVVFHDGVFALTTDLTDELTRTQALSSVYTFFERLMKYRVPRMGLDRFRLYVVLDEIRWFYESLTRFFSVARNHRVSTFVLNQMDEQFEQLGMPAIAKTLPSLLRLRIQYRAQTTAAADDMALRIGKYDPFGMQKRVTTGSRATGQTRGRREGANESDTDSESYGSNEGMHAGRGYSWGSNAGWSADGDGAMRYSGGVSSGDSRDDGWSASDSAQYGSSHTRGKSWDTSTSESETETVIEHLLTASVGDQHFLRMQDMRALPEHCALVNVEGENRLVRMLPFRGFATRRAGKDILAAYRAAAHRDLTTRRVPRTPYDPLIHMTRPAPTADDTVRPGKRGPEAGPAPTKATRREKP